MWQLKEKLAQLREKSSRQYQRKKVQTLDTVIPHVCTCTYRFQIEDVQEETSPSIAPSTSQIFSPTQHESTFTSFGYNTAEAVPMTVYYRDNNEDGGMAKSRPTLDYLRERSGTNLPELAEVS